MSNDSWHTWHVRGSPSEPTFAPFFLADRFFPFLFTANLCIPSVLSSSWPVNAASPGSSALSPTALACWVGAMLLRF